MISLKSYRHRGPHGQRHVDRERLVALILIWTALVRVFVWTFLLCLYLGGIHFAVHLFQSVSFVSILSVLALLLTDWGQMAASLAQLTAGHTHADVEHTRKVLGIDLDKIEEDIAHLADLQPGPEASTLATQIRASLQRGNSDT